MKKINRYVAAIHDKDGNLSARKEGLADNRQLAASLMRCSEADIVFVEQVKRPELHRKGDHLARVPFSCAKL